MKQSLLILLFGVILIGSLITWYTVHAPAPEPTLIDVPDIPPAPTPFFTEDIIGYSVEGRPLTRYTFGTGSTTLLFVGGMHGGYEWNSIILAYEFIAALQNKSLPVPEGLSVVVVPNLNPDGLFAATKKEGVIVNGDITDTSMHQTGRGRFNANQVDLNRNFDCKWQAEGTWRGQKVSAGSAPFSEPEAAALRDLVLTLKPAAAVFWHSQANTVYGSECEEGILPMTLALMEEYATAAGYNSVARFDAYPVTGDAEGWLASLGIPAITVELASRTDAEWTQNAAGISALMKLYAF